jgi:hypothetical protein
MAKPCPGLCAAPQPMKSPEQRTWDGTYYTSSTCGTGSSCLAPACAAPGSYVARMCAHKNMAPDAGLSCNAVNQTATCVDIPFTWPPSGPVQGSIGP